MKNNLVPTKVNTQNTRMASAENTIAEVCAINKSAKLKICPFLTVRQGTIFNGIMQSVFQGFMFIILVIAHNVLVEINHKQEVDIMEHEQTIDYDSMRLLNKTYQEDNSVPGRIHDIYVIFKAKKNTDAMIFILKHWLIVVEFYMASSMVSIYAAITRIRLFVQFHLWVTNFYYVALVIIVLVLMFRSTTMHASHLLLISRIVYTKSELGNVPKCLLIPIGIIGVLHAVISFIGYRALYLYGIELRERDARLQNEFKKRGFETNNLVNRFYASFKHLTYFRSRKAEATPV